MHFYNVSAAAAIPSAAASRSMESMMICSSCSSGAAQHTHHHQHQQQQQQHHQHHQQQQQLGFLRISACSSSSSNNKPSPSNGKINGGSGVLTYSPLSISSLLTQKAAAVLSVASERSFALSEAMLSVLYGVVTQQPSYAELQQGTIVDDVVYRQNFVVRSYEVGPDKTATLEALLQYFQETALNHVRLSGLDGNDGFGTTHAMIRNNLIWVVTRMQVEVEEYPAWGQLLEIDTWVAASGKNGMRRDWLVRDIKSSATLARATSTWVMMDKSTRRLSKMPDAVRAEIAPWFLTRTAFVQDSARKVEKVDHASEFIRSGLTARHSDLDMNQHVNNVKYISWMMESLPSYIFDTHQLIGITLEYRRECSKSDVVQSLTSPPQQRASEDGQLLEFTHLLRMEKDGAEIVRSRTAWKCRCSSGAQQQLEQQQQQIQQQLEQQFRQGKQ